MKTVLMAFTSLGAQQAKLAEMVADITKTGRTPEKYGDDFIMDENVHYIFKTITIPNFAELLKGYDEVRCNQIISSLNKTITQIEKIVGNKENTPAEPSPAPKTFGSGNTTPIVPKKDK